MTAAITLVEWDFDGDQDFDPGPEVVTGPTATRTYNSDGSTRVSMRVTDETGAFADATISITVADPPPPPPPANVPPVAQFSVSDASPTVGQDVTLTSFSYDPPPRPNIEATEWDLNYGGNAASFDVDVTGKQPTVKFGTEGTRTIALRVRDGEGGRDIATQAITVSPPAPPPANLPPIAQFSATPLASTVGEQVSFRSFSYDPDGSVASQRWDLDGDGDYDEGVSGPTAFTTFSTPGEKIVRLRVEDSKGAVQAATLSITVQPAVAQPANPSTPKAKLSLLGSLALVRLAGSATMKTTRVQILQVRAPRQSIVEVRCSGKGCPTKSVRKRVKSKPLRFDILERSLRAGTVLTVFIRKSGYVGKYTSFLLRPGKAPKRTDGCVMPGKTKRVRCPAA